MSIKCNKRFETSGSGPNKKAAFYQAYLNAAGRCLAEAPKECKGAVEVGKSGKYYLSGKIHTYETYYECKPEMVTLACDNDKVTISKRANNEIRIEFSGFRCTGQVISRGQDKGDYAEIPGSKANMRIRIKNNNYVKVFCPTYDDESFRRRCHNVPLKDITKLRLMLGLYKDPYNK